MVSCHNVLIKRLDTSYIPVLPKKKCFDLFVFSPSGEPRLQHMELLDMVEKSGAKYERIKRWVETHRETTLVATENYFENKNGSCEVVANTSGKYGAVRLACRQVFSGVRICIHANLFCRVTRHVSTALGNQGF